MRFITSTLVTNTRKRDSVSKVIASSTNPIIREESASESSINSEGLEISRVSSLQNSENPEPNPPQDNIDSSKIIAPVAPVQMQMYTIEYWKKCFTFQKGGKWAKFWRYNYRVVKFIIIFVSITLFFLITDLYALYGVDTKADIIPKVTCLFEVRDSL